MALHNQGCLKNSFPIATASAVDVSTKMLIIAVPPQRNYSFLVSVFLRPEKKIVQEIFRIEFRSFNMTRIAFL
ncbi:unnamed protein product [Cochlearia groenlandica]